MARLKLQQPDVKIPASSSKRLDVLEQRVKELEVYQHGVNKLLIFLTIFNTIAITLSLIIGG